MYAIGDATTTGYELTPVAIAAGRRLADRLFGGEARARIEYANIATVVFSHPPIGMIGLTEPQAKAEYGADKIVTKQARFASMMYALNKDADSKVKTALKLVLLLPEEKVVGLHCIGPHSDEMIQGFAVAVRMGATRADFEAAVAIHPTISEVRDVWRMGAGEAEGWQDDTAAAALSTCDLTRHEAGGDWVCRGCCGGGARCGGGEQAALKCVSSEQMVCDEIVVVRCCTDGLRKLPSTHDDTKLAPLRAGLDRSLATLCLRLLSHARALTPNVHTGATESARITVLLRRLLLHDEEALRRAVHDLLTLGRESPARRGSRTRTFRRSTAVMTPSTRSQEPTVTGHCKFVSTCTVKPHHGLQTPLTQKPVHPITSSMMVHIVPPWQRPLMRLGSFAKVDGANQARADAATLARA